MKLKKFAMFAVVFTLLFALSACSIVHKSFAPTDNDNLALSNKIKITLPNGKSKEKLNYSGDSATEISFSFPKELEFNTILISETQKNIQITYFEWWTTLNGESKMLYKQDEIGKLRYCYVDNIKTDNLTLKIVATDGEYKLENFGIYNTLRPKNDFRITTYVDNLANFNTPEYDRSSINNVTHAILFHSAKFDENGNLNYNLDEINTTIKLIKEETNGKPPVIMLNILQRGTTKVEEEASRRVKENIYYGGMKTNKTKLIKNIVKFLEETGADGISFDYEFPSALKDHLAYSKFLVELNNSAEMVISVAYADWNLGFSKSAIKAVDYFELMAYDLDDSRGNHSGFENCAIKVTNSSLKFGIPREKINLGVPFYSRPTDMLSYWGTYKGDDINYLDQFDNFAEKELAVDIDGDGVLETIKGRWYNSKQMIKDKTAFAYDIGLGGMMIWHFSCDVAYDNDLSLLKAMNSVLD